MNPYDISDRIYFTNRTSIRRKAEKVIDVLLVIASGIGFTAIMAFLLAL